MRYVTGYINAPYFTEKFRYDKTLLVSGEMYVVFFKDNIVRCFSGFISALWLGFPSSASMT